MIDPMDDLLHRALLEQEQKLQKLDGRLTELRSLQHQRDKVYALVCQMRSNMDMPPYGVREATTEPVELKLAVSDSLRFEDRPLWKAAEDILHRTTEPMTVQDLTKELFALGYKVSDRTGVETVRAALNRKPALFGRVGRRYALL